jgi:hypothetical protein
MPWRKWPDYFLSIRPRESPCTAVVAVLTSPFIDIARKPKSSCATSASRLLAIQPA